MKFRLSAALLGASLVIAVPTVGSAAPVNLSFDLELNGMSVGTCPAGLCGQVSVIGDTTTSLAYTVTLATGVSFHASYSGSSGTGNFFYFQLTDPGGPAITFSGIGVDGTIGSTGYSYNLPVAGSFVPNPGNFPGPYNFAVGCTNDTSGKICNGPLTFIASGATAANPFVIGAPLGGGLFPTDNIAFVVDLSVSGECGDDECIAGTGLVGDPPPGETPLPGAVWLFGTVIAGGAGYGRWRRKRMAATASA